MIDKDKCPCGRYREVNEIGGRACPKCEPGLVYAWVNPPRNLEQTNLSIRLSRLEAHVSELVRARDEAVGTGSAEGEQIAKLTAERDEARRFHSDEYKNRLELTIERDRLLRQVDELKKMLEQRANPGRAGKKIKEIEARAKEAEAALGGIRELVRQWDEGFGPVSYDAFAAKVQALLPKTEALGFPAVGESATWDQVWQHCKRDPFACYQTWLRNAPNFTHRVYGGEYQGIFVLLNHPHDKKASIVFSSREANPTGSDWDFVRVDDIKPAEKRRLL